MTLRESQNKRLLEWLKQGKAIMPLMAQDKLGIMRLAARCWDLNQELRKKGQEIICEMQYVGPVKFGRYYLKRSRKA